MNNDNNTINLKQLANLIFPIFARKSPFDYNDNFEKIYSLIPIEILTLITTYFDLYKDCEDLEDINLIIDTSNYFENPQDWLTQFAENLSNEYSKISNPIEVDFEKEFIIIEYKREELAYLQELDKPMIQQLNDMSNWILAEKQRRRVFKEFESSPIEGKPYIKRKIN